MNTSDNESNELSEEKSSNSSGFNMVTEVREVVDQLRKEVADKSQEMRNVIERIRGKVFHYVTSNNQVYIYRVGFDGIVTLEKTIKSLNLRATKLIQARQKLFEAGKSVPLKAQRQWRAVVTGDPNKRIRDHMKEVPQVKFLDKISFFLGVLVICISEWLIFRQPNWFPLYYYTLMAILFATRYIQYKEEKQQYYMLDLCYFINISCIFQTAFYPDNIIWFKMNYSLSLGPLIIAIVVWHNSLVFHSLDKVTSFFLHAFPPMVCHLFRWRFISTHKINNESLGFLESYGYSLLFYLSWQALYSFLTECTIIKKNLDEDPDLITSIRYLARDKKNVNTIFVNKMCVKYGLTKEGEYLNPDDSLTKIIYALSQLLYTLLALIPVTFLYDSYILNCTYMTLLYMVGTWNGASYYIEVFSKRYNLKFEQRDTKPESTDKLEEDDDFVENLENLDLNEPHNLEMYTELLKELDSNSSSEYSEMTDKKQGEDKDRDIIEDEEDEEGKNSLGLIQWKDYNPRHQTLLYITEDGLHKKMPVLQAHSLYPETVLRFFMSKYNSPNFLELEDDGSSKSESSESDRWEVLNHK